MHSLILLPYYFCVGEYIGPFSTPAKALEKYGPNHTTPLKKYEPAISYTPPEEA